MVNSILGYGEDSLTLWALTKGLSEFLGYLGESAAEPTEIFYRPSFGRNIGIGEFDFIIKIGRKTYFGESKWPLSAKRNERNTCRIRLGANQIRRHAQVVKFMKKEHPSGSILAKNIGFIRKRLGEITPVNVLLVFAKREIKSIVVNTKAVYNNIVELDRVKFTVVHMPIEHIPFAEESNFITGMGN